MLKVNRSNFYYKPRKNLNRDNIIANEINELWSKYSFLGHRKVTIILREQRGYIINRKKVLRLMRLMKLKAVYAKPRTIFTNKKDVTCKHPYLLKDLSINQANQVWSTDITYIRMPKGFVYLTALIDVYSRYVVSWKLSISMDTEFCLAVLNKGLEQNKPDIINSDQGSQFTSNDWVNSLKNNNIKISMDGVGRWADNIYIERFWRTLKQEQIYINPSDNIADLKQRIDSFIEFYNYQRPHQGLQYQTPSQVFYGDKMRKKELVF